tara:strand:+ start:189 stop:632 length:444 start_codon:yes stop_codon:yes gene_type:complete
LEFPRGNGGRGGVTKYPWVNLLVDKLLLFSYIIGDIPITVDGKGTEIRIGRYEDKSLKPVEESANDLNLLSFTSIRGRDKEAQYPDKRLARLYYRNENRRNTLTGGKKYKNWKRLIDEIGKDEIVRNYFGRNISFNDVSHHFKSNRI